MNLWLLLALFFLLSTFSPRLLSFYHLRIFVTFFSGCFLVMGCTTKVQRKLSVSRFLCVKAWAAKTINIQQNQEFCRMNNISKLTLLRFPFELFSTHCLTTEDQTPLKILRNKIVVKKNQLEAGFC